MSFSKRHLAVLALIICSTIWGAAAPIFKWSMQEVPPYTLAILRFFIAALLILPFTYKNLTIKKEHYLKIIYLSFVGITLHIALFFLGLQLTSSINAPIINAGTPIFMIFGSVWYLHEKLKKKVIIGTTLSMIGIIFIILEPIFITGPDGSVLGNMLIFLSMLCVVIYTLQLKKFNLPYSTLTISFWTFLIGSLFFLPAFISEQIHFNSFAHMDGKSYVGIIYGSIFSSALAYFLYDFGLKYIDGIKIGIFTYIEPIITVLIAVPLLGEKITLFYIIGSLIVFLGIFIAEAHLYHPKLPGSLKELVREIGRFASNTKEI